jgi:hypothetical protein
VAEQAAGDEIANLPTKPDRPHPAAQPILI